MDLVLNLVQDGGPLVDRVALQKVCLDVTQFRVDGMNGLGNDNRGAGLNGRAGLGVGRGAGDGSMESLDSDRHCNMPLNVNGIWDATLNVNGIGNGHPLIDSPDNWHVLDDFDRLLHLYGADNGHLLNHLHLANHRNLFDHLDGLDHLHGPLDNSRFRSENGATN